MESHQRFAKEKYLEITLIPAFVIRSYIVVLQDKLLKHARMVLVSIHIFLIVTGQGFWDVLTLEEVCIFSKQSGQIYFFNIFL